MQYGPCSALTPFGHPLGMSVLTWKPAKLWPEEEYGLQLAAWPWQAVHSESGRGTPVNSAGPMSAGALLDLMRSAAVQPDLVTVSFVE